LAIALRLKQETSVTNRWLGERLRMGHPNGLIANMVASIFLSFCKSAFASMELICPRFGSNHVFAFKKGDIGCTLLQF